MICSKFACKAFDPASNTGVFIQKNSLNVQNYNNNSFSTIINIAGTVLDVSIYQAQIHTLFHNGRSLFYKISTLNGATITTQVINIFVSQKMKAFNILFNNQLVFVTSSEKEIYLLNTHVQPLKLMNTSALITSVLSIDDYLFIVTESQSYKLQILDSKIVSEEKVEFPSTFAFAFNNNIVCGNGKTYTEFLQETEENIIKAIKQNDIYKISYNNYQFDISSAQINYFQKHLIHGISLPQQYHLLELYSQKFTQQDNIVTISDQNIDINLILKQQDIYRFDEIITVNYYPFDLVFLQILYQEEYYFIVFDIKRNQSDIVYISQTKLQFITENITFKSLEEVKSKLVLFNTYQIIRDNSPIYQYDSEILSAQLINNQILVSTYFDQTSTIYKNYEKITELDHQIQSVVSIKDDFYIAISQDRIFYFTQLFQFSEPISLDGQKLTVVKDEIYIVAQESIKQLQSLFYDVFKILINLNSAQKVDFSNLSQYIGDDVIIRQIYLFLSTQKSELLQEFLLFVPFDLFMFYLSELKSCDEQAMATTIFSKFKTANHIQKIQLFNYCNYLFQKQKEPIFSVDFPNLTIEPTTKLVVSFLTQLYWEQDFKFFIFLAVCYGFKLDVIMEHFYVLLKKNVKKQKQFLKSLALKVKIISLHSLNPMNLEQNWLKQIFIALYELFGYNPISGKVQTLKETNPQKFVLMKKDSFYYLRFTVEARNWMKTFEKSIVVSKNCSVDLPKIYYSYSAQVAVQEVQQVLPEVEVEKNAGLQEVNQGVQGLKMEVAGEDDDDWGKSTKKVKFTIKKKVQVDNPAPVQFVIPTPIIQIPVAAPEAAPVSVEAEDAWGETGWDVPSVEQTGHLNKFNSFVVDISQADESVSLDEVTISQIYEQIFKQDFKQALKLLPSVSSSPENIVSLQVISTICKLSILGIKNQDLQKAYQALALSQALSAEHAQDGIIAFMISIQQIQVSDACYQDTDNLQILIQQIQMTYDDQKVTCDCGELVCIVPGKCEHCSQQLKVNLLKMKPCFSQYNQCQVCDAVWVGDSNCPYCQ